MPASPKIVAIDTLAVRGLRKHGYARLCKGYPADTSKRASQISVAFTVTIALTIAFILSSLLGWSLVLSMVGVAGAIFLAVVAAQIFKFNVAIIAYTMFAAYFGTGAYFLGFRSNSDLAFVFGTPVIVVVGSIWGIRAIKSATALPLFLAAALIVVVAPLLTEDPWRFAPASGGRLALFAAIAIVPLVVVVLFRLLRYGAVVPMYRAALAHR